MNDEWKSPTEFAETMGMSRRTIWRWMDQGLPYAKIGRTRFINTGQANDWMNDHVRRDDQDRVGAIVNEIIEGSK